MKSNLMTWLSMCLVVVGSSFAQARTIDDTHYITNTELIDLSIDSSSIELGLPYPGPNISSLCGAELRADSYNRGNYTIADLLNVIEIKNVLGVNPVVTIKNDMTVNIDLSAATGTYTTVFSISTKDGSSLKETIAKTIGKKRTVVLVGTTCSK